MNVMQRIIRLLCIGEIFLVIGIFIFGSQGIHAYLTLQRENDSLKHDIITLENELGNLQEEQDLWHTHAAFYCEQQAREKLHMARNDEIIYYAS